ncbi:hypothetical protein SAMN05421819_2072 [Bryocella elongata]|uniref:Uncharacterized protein n=2 Tax=Bryocella elongata TaxID=863522 RepID=A0A1H5Y1N0_9BACT|nr:hypothetical protein SAMN05421819_2072 [Bryocella elongata]
MTYAADDKRLAKWEKGLQDAVLANPGPWNSYDDDIKAALAIYTAKLSSIPGYQEPDWKLIKAMIWVETGALNSQWTTAPMQIGVNGDPGLRELLRTPQGQLILPASYRGILTEANVPKDGHLNIEAGIGYLLKIQAKFGWVPALSTDRPEHVTMNQQAALARFGVCTIWELPEAQLVSTMEEPMLPPISVIPVLPPAKSAHGPHKKAAPKKILGITGWKTLTPEFVGAHYNAGDGNYAKKLRYAMDLMDGKVPIPPKPAVTTAPPLRKAIP